MLNHYACDDIHKTENGLESVSRMYNQTHVCTCLGCRTIFANRYENVKINIGVIQVTTVSVATEKIMCKIHNSVTRNVLVK